MEMIAEATGCCDRLGLLVHLTPLPTIEWNLDRRVVDWNPAAERVFEYPRHEALGHTLEDGFIVPGEARDQSLATWEQVAVEGRSVHIVGENLTRSGKRIQCAWYLAPMHDADGAISGVLSQAQDISVVKAYQRRIHSLAFADALTGLPNRALFIDRLRQAAGRAHRNHEATGLMALGLDRFKAVNDALGHSAGDEILRQTAKRLQNCLRSYDTVARFSGDMFVISLPDVRDGADLGRLAHKILEAFERPFKIGESTLFVSASIGVAVYPDDSEGVEQLMGFAEAAMYHAKACGRNNFQFYSAELTAHAAERLKIEAALRGAVERGELEVYYQPQVDLGNGRVVGVEALLRWNHPVWGMVMPDRFIGIAEDTGLIVGIGEWVLRQACKDARAWRDAGRAIKVAVNLSPRQFLDGNLLSTIAAILRETGCEAEWLELEITERLLIEDKPLVRRTLGQLTLWGVSIAIDDFGTGYSALSYINRFPIDVLKIDRSFVSSVFADQSSAELARAIATLARTLGLRVVAEGVENQAQQAFLKAAGCHVGQGFLYGKPAPKNEAELLLSSKSDAELQAP
jgi:diguanylate cyclase (GGDEF)-like protein/PAS domain S-box-containing protein